MPLKLFTYRKFPSGDACHPLLPPRTLPGHHWRFSGNGLFFSWWKSIACTGYLLGVYRNIPWPYQATHWHVREKREGIKPRKVWESAFKYLMHTCEKTRVEPICGNCSKSETQKKTLVDNQLHLNVRSSSFVCSSNPMLVDANSVTLYSCLFFFLGTKVEGGVSFCVFQCKVILIRKDQGFSSKYLTFPSESTFFSFFFFKRGKERSSFSGKEPLYAILKLIFRFSFP